MAETAIFSQIINLKMPQSGLKKLSLLEASKRLLQTLQDSTFCQYINIRLKVGPNGGQSKVKLMNS